MQKNKGLVQYAEEYGTYPYGMRNMGNTQSEGCPDRSFMLYGVATVSRLLKITGLFCHGDL